MSESEAHLFVTDDGQYLLQGQALALPELDVALRVLKAAQPNVDLRVVGSAKVTDEQVAPAMRLVQQHGLAKIGGIAGGPRGLGPARQGLHTNFERTQTGA